ncbi:ABC transporter substrate-binding protein [Patescibacteria group bacterium]|nr:ABC transporter substrate-binding protein [Patescibacteria group bacterium]
MRNLRYFIRLFVAFISRFKGLLLIGVVIGVFLFIVISVVFPLLFARTTQRIGITGRFHTGTLPDFILAQISDGLTAIDETQTVVPNIAGSWETPDKGKTWIFNLREGLLWHDGDKVDSSSIVYEFIDVVIERPDESTISFKLKDVFTPFPAVVSRPTFKKGFIGTGEWRVSKVSLSGSFIQRLTLVDDAKNKIIYKFYPTEDRAKLAFKLGRVDTLVEILEPSPFDKWNNVESSAVYGADRVVTIFFNTGDKYLSDKTLRQALIYAIDKGSIDGPRAISPISPNSWAFNPSVKDYSYDVERAKELLEEVDEALREDLKITLVSSPIMLPAAEKIAEYWREIGIDINVLVSSVVPEEFQAYLTIYDIPEEPDQYAVWHSTQIATNVSSYSSPRIDKLLEDGRAELSLGDRREIYLDFQRFLVEDSPAAFLYHPPVYTIERK